MNTEYEELLKKNVLKMVEEHKESCNDPHCGVSTHLVECLIRKADIKLTEEESMICM